MIPEAMGDFLVWVVDTVFGDPSRTVVLVLVAIALLAAWRVTLAIFPDKRCDRCSGAGSYGPGKLRRTCGRCGGSGRVSRVGAGS